MPRPARPWFRFYVEALSDRKLRRLKPSQRWLWVAVLSAARQSPIAGLLLVSEDEPCTDTDLADIAGMLEKEVSATMPRFEAAQMIHHDEDFNCWAVTNWEGRQFESDDVTQRTRRARERSNVVPGNDLKPSREHSGNGGGNAPETETESETESDLVSTTLLAAANAVSSLPQQRIQEACQTVAQERAESRGDVGKGWIVKATEGMAGDHAVALEAHLAAHPEATPGDLAALVRSAIGPLDRDEKPRNYRAETRPHPPRFIPPNPGDHMSIGTFL